MCDVPGSYLCADMLREKRVTLRLCGIFVDIMCKINTEYENYVTKENREKVLKLRTLRNSF